MAQPMEWAIVQDRNRHSHRHEPRDSACEDVLDCRVAETSRRPDSLTIAMSQRIRIRLSRGPITLLIAVCLVLAAILIPVAAHLPRFVEAELVMGAWWFIWVITLSALLFRGNTVDDECKCLRFGGGKTGAAGEAIEAVGCSGDIWGAALGEGCLTAIMGILAVILFIGALALLVEFVIPAIALILLASIGGMLSRAVNDLHKCQHHLGRSIGWALVWSTVYVGPVAGWVILFLSTLPQK